MAEYTNVLSQAVAAGQNVLYTETAVAGSPCIYHREGSGLVTLRGITEQRRARYKASFSGNIALPTGGAAGAISVALSVAGEPLASSTAIVTPAAAGEFFNVYSEALIDVPRGCCVSIAVENTSGVAIDVQNANLIVERIA